MKTEAQHAAATLREVKWQSVRPSLFRPAVRLLSRQPQTFDIPGIGVKRCHVLLYVECRGSQFYADVFSLS